MGATWQNLIGFGRFLWILDQFGISIFVTIKKRHNFFELVLVLLALFVLFVLFVLLVLFVLFVLFVFFCCFVA